MEDLSKKENTVSCQMEDIIKNIDGFQNISELKEAFICVISSKSTSISKRKKNEYIEKMDTIHRLDRLVWYITDVYMCGAHLGMNQTRKSYK